MKHIYQTILIGLSLLAAATTVRAQDVLSKYKEGGGVATSKTVSSQNEDGSYTITLETFAIGTSTMVTTSKPVDVILVLDLSSSMKESYSGTTRLLALKEATISFVEEIARNDEYDDNNNKRDKLLGNRIQIITYNTNAEALFDSFQPASTNLSSITDEVDDMDTDKGTHTDYGMNLAKTWAQTSYNANYWTQNNLKEDNEHNIVVVMFTDGCPSTSGSTSFTPSYAAAAVNYSYTIKQEYGATVYSVGLINWDDLGGEDSIKSTYVKNMMEYISSNFPKGQATYTGDEGETNLNRATFTCTGERADTQYYADANEVKLSEIFESIAQASGGSSETIGSSTQVRDVVSSSFAIAFPSTVTTDAQKQAWIDENVKVYTSAISEDGKSWGEEQEYSDATITYYTTTADGETYDAINVEGFDYSLDDNPKQSGNGNWVGLRYRSGSNTPFYAGKKLVIKFNVKIEEGITGGNTATNIGTSGVYLKNEETGEYTCINAYEVPSKTLSITITISKDGLRSGESATFLIKKAEPLKDEDGNIVYNAIGKPQPDESTWDTDHKVILTNKSTKNGDTVVKTLYGLDPNYVYEVVEDDWGWAYDMQGKGTSMTTSSVVINPFEFTNKEKTEINGEPIRKHAEAVTINHFGYKITGGDFKGKQEEHYKSSKTTF